MIVTGIGDEAGNRIETQITACKKLGWKHLEMRGIEVAGHRKANYRLCTLLIVLALGTVGIPTRVRTSSLLVVTDGFYEWRKDGVLHSSTR